VTAIPSGYRLIEDQDEIDAVAAHAFLTESYWSPGIPLETVEKAIRNSFCVAVQYHGEQVAMARLITDHATFAYLADVYVLAPHRRKSLSQAMLGHLQGHPQLQGLRRWMLFTRDAHGVYAKQGWEPLAHPERAMLLNFPDVYE
jgi:GNAT superfamily N-acetyltransferase